MHMLPNTRTSAYGDARFDRLPSFPALAEGVLT
jgi:hypothetical protein